MIKSQAEQVLEAAMQLALDGTIEGTIKFKDRIDVDIVLTFEDDEQPFRIRIAPTE